MEMYLSQVIGQNQQSLAGFATDQHSMHTISDNSEEIAISDSSSILPEQGTKYTDENLTGYILAI